MIKIKLCLLMIANIFLLSCSCTREQIGISELEWTSYSKDKRSIMLNRCDLIRKERKSILQKYKPNKTTKEFLVVKIFDGKVMFPPNFISWQDYSPLEFGIYKDECREFELKSLVNSKVKSRLGVCYIDNELYLDPSYHDLAKERGTVTIPSTPLWGSGFLYKKINSAGYIRFNDVMISVRQGKLEDREGLKNEKQQ